MVLRQFGVAPANRPARQKGKARASIAAQGFFVPLITAWGAALVGLPIAVLSSSAIARMIAITGTGALGPWAQVVYSAFAASIGAVIAFAIAREIHDRAITPSGRDTVLPLLAALSASHTSRPAPLGEKPLVEKPHRDAEEKPKTESGTGLAEPAVQPENQDGHRSEQDQAGPAPLPEDAEASEPAPTLRPEAPEAPEPRAAGPDGSPRRALEQLRATPPDELSLLQMVERFGAAMHEQQRSGHPARRGEALAEALQALELFTQEGFDLAGPANEPDRQSGNAASL